MGRGLDFVAELFRRKVVRVLCAYVAIFWLLAQGFASLFPVLGIPNWILRAFIITAVAAIPLLALLSWKYDVVPPQLVRDPKDVEDEHPTLDWARRRHDGRGAGLVVLQWLGENGSANLERFVKPVSIGRDATNDIELPDQRVSRFHAVLWAEGGSWRVRDLDSTNGTFVDQARVSGAVSLPAMCELRFHAQGPTVRMHIDRPTETLAS